MKIIPTILCGGAGSRLWPLSRKQSPKPFIKLADGQSLLHKTLQRACAVPGYAELCVLASGELFFEIEQELRSAGLAEKIRLLLEPCARNTAPACLMAALETARLHGTDALLLVLPCDQVITDEAAFLRAVQEATQLAMQGKLVTFGITPTAPAIGYGYVKYAGNKVERFVEKPDQATAQTYLAAGDYLWNAGIFCFKASVLIEEMRQHAPDVYEAVQAAADVSAAHPHNAQVLLIDKERFAKAPNISLDYALMERSTNVAVVPCAMGWNDVGSWDELSQYLGGTADGSNLTHGTVLCEDTRNCFVASEGRAVGLVAVEDLIVVDTADALLITARGNNQAVRAVYDTLQEQGHPAHKAHRMAHRPWGTYRVLEQGPGFKVKRIEISPGASISLQQHAHRSEHWVVVSGQAMVENDGEKMTLQPGQSTYVPVGSKHRISNSGAELLVIIEVQTGNYLEEDDIVRFEDNYGRTVQR